MYTEIEAKLKVDSLEPVREKLQELGAEFVEEQFQMDILFDDANQTMIKADSCLRFRRQISDNQTKHILAYKGPKQDGNYKKRLEIEVEVNKNESMLMLLSALGYESKIIVEKNRSLWRYNQCEVALDSLKLLGDFVEIEGPSEDIINDVQKALGLEHLDNIAESYATLIMNKRDSDTKVTG